VVVDDVEKQVTAGDVISLPVGCRHTVMADSELEIIEVQIGKEISVEDKQKFELGKKQE
jgi:mannose-1-phosphate guanylyltransferase